jgi:hypothetical protein
MQGTRSVTSCGLWIIPIEFLESNRRIDFVEYVSIASQFEDLGYLDLRLPESNQPTRPNLKKEKNDRLTPRQVGKLGKFGTGTSISRTHDDMTKRQGDLT